MRNLFFKPDRKSFQSFSASDIYRGRTTKLVGWGPIKNFFNNRRNLNLRCPGETSDTYLSLDKHL
jgi:hypothetical protein